MDIIGIWTIKEALTMGEDLKSVWKFKEDIMADESADEDLKGMFATRFAFCEDGFLRSLIPIPEGASQEQIDEAVASGQVELYDGGFIAIERHPWKMEDGTVMVDTGAKGEVLGETISPWVEAKINDGVMEYVMYRLVKERS